MARKGKWIQAEFFPKNPGKCLNQSAIKSRSSWEHSYMRWLDEHPDVVEWGSEVIQIPYFNPLKKRPANYIPDFLIRYRDKNNIIHNELIEIKPLKETMLEHAKSKYDKLMLVQNVAKWKAAQSFCRKAGLEFRIINEQHLFRNATKR